MTKRNCTTQKPSKQVRKRITTSEFVRRSKELHGDKFTYEYTVYKKMSADVQVVCDKHGLVTILASKHLTFHGCSECTNSNNRHGHTQDYFLSKCNDVHGKYYDYSLTKYKSLSKKIDVICSLHGLFSLQASSHMNGSGCPSCAPTHANRLTNEHFLTKARAAHGNRYDYSLVDYKGRRELVTIICKEHGEFKQKPESHYIYGGCHQCSGTRRVTKKVFLSRAKSVHGSRYDYALSKVRGSHSHIDIICSVHGVFSQIAKNHMEGQGCPTCAYRGGFTANGFSASCEKNKGQGLLYIIRCWIDGESFYKVGITSTSVDTRFKSDMPYSYSVVYEVFEEARIVYDLEKNIHKLLRNYTHEPSINFGGKTECFSTIAPVRKLIEMLVNTKQLQLIA